MSTETGTNNGVPSGFPELTELGTQIELLRVGRGLSKQYLARQAGTSRQQLWRVMTGKSELTTSLRQRLAEALQVDGDLLHRTDRIVRTAAAHSAFEAAIADFPRTTAPAVPDQTRVAPQRVGRPAVARIERYLDDCSAIERTLATMPSGTAGSRIKRSLFNVLEEVAAEHGVRLCAEFFQLRGRVINGEA